jgi:Glycosyltransferase family 87
MGGEAAFVRGAVTKRHSPIFLAIYTVFLFAMALCLSGVVISVLSAKIAYHDTICFWGSGHLLVHGGNPYDRRAVAQLESSVDFPTNADTVFMTRNPPSALFLMAPLGFLSLREAVPAWSLLLAVFLMVAVLAIRSMADRGYERGYVLLACCFAPAWYCIEVGQSGLVVLLGLALFLSLHESKPLWAGAALSLCAAKPHLLLPFGVVLLAWIITRKRWMVLWGAILALVVESLIALTFDHAIWTHYRATMGAEPIVNEYIPTLGVGLRFLIKQSAMWLEFVPAALGTMWGLWYFWRNRERWDWRTHGSTLTLVSLAAAPYAWITDQVLALPAILFALLSVHRPRRGSVTILMAIMSVTALELLIPGYLLFRPNMLLSVVWLGWYLYATSGTAAKNAELAAVELSGDEESRIAA